MELINKEMLNLCYKFFNRFITADELVVKLGELENPTDDLVTFKESLKEFVETVPNVEDDYVINEKKKIQELIDKLGNVPKEEGTEKLCEHIESLKKGLDRNYDSKDRWYKVTEFINDNKYFNDCFDGLSKYELLEFIAQYICVPFPPQINNDEFDELVNVGVEHDEKEWLWRMAINYEYSVFSFNAIADYFIKEKDGYYLGELVSGVRDSLDMEHIIENVKDVDLINDLKSREDVLKLRMSDEELERLFNK